MKTIKYFSLGILYVLFSTSPVLSRSGIVSALSGGRLGDNLVAVSHAAWLSYKYGYELGYMPFEYSDKLVLQYKAHRYTKEWLGKFSSHVRYSAKHDLERYIRNSVNGTCNIIPYFPEFLSEYGFCADFQHLSRRPIDVDWNEPTFKELLRNLFTPVDRVSLISLPSDRISVALHMRRGGGFDPDPSDGTGHHGPSVRRCVFILIS